MWTLWFWALLISVIVGLAVKYGVQALQLPASRGGLVQVSWIEFALVVFLNACLVIPTASYVGLKMARASQLTYHEFWGGYETAAEKTATPCSRDGRCEHNYDCDPYNHVHEETHNTYDSKGNVTGSYTTYSNHTHYHSCPYATVEYGYKIKTTLGDHHIASGVFDQTPVEWRAGSGLPGNVPRGDPAFWVAARRRLEAGTPGPATADKTYKNYILASTRTILKKYSDAVEKYTKAGLLPAPTSQNEKPIFNWYYADKMQFVGNVPGDRTAWNFALARLNAALGTDLQGDMHVLAIDAGKVRNVDEYVGAVNAYWQDKKLGRRALSKNGIGLVLGVNDGKIVWARAFTGMPVGNEALSLDLQTGLEGKAFTPAIFGEPKGVLYQDGEKIKAKVVRSDSPVENALWGPHKFVRVCMTCKTKGDVGVGYSYLGGEIQPSSGQRALIIFVSVLFSLLLWVVALLVGIGERKSKDDEPYDRSDRGRGLPIDRGYGTWR